MKPVPGPRRRRLRRLARLGAVAGIGFLPACETTPAMPGAPPPRTGSDAAATGAQQVEILDAWFVRVDGVRLALDEFVYRTRRNCRRRTARALAAPTVHLSWVEGAAAPTVIEALIAQLRLAGVQHILLGSS